MGTRWRGLLAPINKPTGDGRRMKTGAFTHRELPLALKWQRVDDNGHDTSVVIGLMDAINIDDKAGEVWGEGELFDDQPHLPRLSEDVAEALLLTSKKIIGPSVDPGSAEAMVVETGTDEPITEERAEELWMQAMETGEEPDLELLFVHYEIAAATLVVIPAFAEARPFELIPSEPAKTPAAAALVAAVTASATPLIVPADVFDAPDPALGAFPFMTEDRGEGFVRITGYVAEFEVCHVGIPHHCTYAPHTTVDYALFHRYPINTTNGLMFAGRLTTGLGRVGTGCTCCHTEDHACDDFSLSQSIAHYDQLETIADIRAGEYDHGIWFAGVLAPNVSAAAKRVLARREVSGDWRLVGGVHEMTEVLALAKSQPGFPLSVKLRDGQRTAITAAGIIRPDRPPVVAQYMNHTQMARDVADLVIAELRPATTVEVVAGPPVDVDPTALTEPDADPEQPVVDEASALLAEVDAAIAAVDPDARLRAATAADLLKEMETASV